MSEAEPSRTRFRLQTLMFIVVILGLGVGMFMQRMQFEGEYERVLAISRMEVERQRTEYQAAIDRANHPTKELLRQESLVEQARREANQANHDRGDTQEHQVELSVYRDLRS